MASPAEHQRAYHHLHTDDKHVHRAGTINHAAPGGASLIYNITLLPSASTQTLTIKHEGLPMPGASSTSKSPEEAVKELQYKHLPQWLQTFCKFMDKVFKWVLWGIGLILAAIGIALLIGGTLYCIYVLRNTLQNISKEGFTGIVLALVKTGAVPSVLFGGAMLHYGRGLMKADTSHGNFLSFVAPAYNWFWPYADVIDSNANPYSPLNK